MKTIQLATTAPFRRKTARILAGSIAALVSAGSFAQAASQIWDGGSGANGNWSTLLNWVGDTAAPGGHQRHDQYRCRDVQRRHFCQ